MKQPDTDLRPATFEGVTLPNGWSVSPLDEGSKVHVVIQSPHLVSVTVDFKARGFRAGMTSTGRLTSEGTYGGLAWKQKLVAAAVRWLDQLVP